MQINDNFYMKLAIDEAWKYQLLTYPNPAVGCVVVKNGEILSIEAHKEAGKPHAELNALKAAFIKKHPNTSLQAINEPFKIHDFLIEHHKGFFYDCEIFVTLEPCSHKGKTPSCARLLEEVQPLRVVVSVKDTHKIASGGVEILQKKQIETTVGILSYEGENLLLPFLTWQKKSCIFYKMAQTLNGTVEGKISSNHAQAYVHTVRDKIDLLVIGGNTVRIDRPTLDARYVAGKAPHVFIYSHGQNFDKTIPLFKIPHRSVIISDDLFKLLDYKFVMVEGTYSLLQQLKDKMDFFIFIISPKVKKGLNALTEVDIDFEILHENYIGEDKIVFCKNKRQGE